MLEQIAPEKEHDHHLFQFPEILAGNDLRFQNTHPAKSIVRTHQIQRTDVSPEMTDAKVMP